MVALVVVASYRGPTITASGAETKGTGGLIQVLQPWARDRAAHWVFAADQQSSDEGPTGSGRWAPILVEGELRHGHYDVIANSLLWPHFHGLRERTAELLRDRAKVAGAWESFRSVNQLFAERIAALSPPDSVVVVHDYQLLLVPGLIRQLRPDLRVAYFHHIPFSSAAEFDVFPAPWRREIAESLGGCACGFQSTRWEDRYLDFCTAEGISGVTTFVAPVSPARPDLDRAAHSPEVRRLRRQLCDRVGGRKLIVRVDRADPMKNVLGGVRALDLLLSREPAWRREVVFAHHLVPTRGSIGSYRRHLDEVLAEIDAVNRRWGDGDWEPIHVSVADRREYGLALFTEYDVLLVNPLREGMNLVAHEGPLLNARNGTLVLSREAGAHDILAGAAIGIDPGSDADTAAALARALAMPTDERATRVAALQAALSSLDSDTWHDKLVRAGRPR